METKMTKWAFRIERMQDGGFVVLDQWRSDPYTQDRGALQGPVFAATTIDECLKYIKKELTPDARQG